MTVQQAPQFGDGTDIGQIALVVLDDQRKLLNIVALLCQIGFEIIHALNVFFQALFLAVGHEDDSIQAFENQFAAGVVNNLARNGVEMKFGGEPTDFSNKER